ncbi:winged helix-turn-helix transcriptional regulator [Aeoliella mucimassa]|nr:winged helix-turn-helix transcriptional regulator [Aeoliella mucimassa]
MINEIRMLLAEEKLSQRQIATRLGVSRGTVNNLATALQTTRTQRSEVDHSGVQRIGRCPHCGARVQLPCVACQARAYRRRQHHRRGFCSASVGLEYDPPWVA